jgi:hypothetical protein
MSARILVVDDVPANVKLLEARLSAEYFDVLTASNGAEALEICARAECDIILLDAEAINEVSGPTAEAYGYVNQVRARAKVPNLTAGLSKDAFRDSVYLERRFELALEEHGLIDNRRNWAWSKARLEPSMTGPPGAGPGAAMTSPCDAGLHPGIHERRDLR